VGPSLSSFECRRRGAHSDAVLLGSPTSLGIVPLSEFLSRTLREGHIRRTHASMLSRGATSLDTPHGQGGALGAEERRWWAHRYPHSSAGGETLTAQSSE